MSGLTRADCITLKEHLYGRTLFSELQNMSLQIITSERMGSSGVHLCIQDTGISEQLETQFYICHTLLLIHEHVCLFQQFIQD